MNIHPYFPSNRLRAWGTNLPKTLGQAIDFAIQRLYNAEQSINGIAANPAPATPLISETGTGVTTFQAVAWILVNPRAFPGKIPTFKVIIASGTDGQEVRARLVDGTTGTPVPGAAVSSTSDLPVTLTGVATLPTLNEHLYAVEISAVNLIDVDLYWSGVTFEVA